MTDQTKTPTAIFQIMYRLDGGGGWVDVERDEYDSKLKYPREYRGRIVYAAPAEQTAAVGGPDIKQSRGSNVDSGHLVYSVHVGEGSIVEMVDLAHVAPLLAEAQSARAAIKTLESMGYTHTGGINWRPPLGKAPNFDLIDELRAEVARLTAELDRKP